MVHPLQRLSHGKAQLRRDYSGMRYSNRGEKMQRTFSKAGGFRSRAMVRSLPAVFYTALPLVLGIWAEGAPHGEPAVGEGGGVPAWYTPFQYPQTIDPLREPKCRGAWPGFTPEVLQVRDALPPITSLDDLKKLKSDQRVLVVSARFGLGNALRNWVSAYFFAMFTGRRIVLLHGGKHYGVFTSLCKAFHCRFDHIKGSNDQESLGLEKKFTNTFSPRYVNLGNAMRALLWNDTVVYSQGFHFWDHWWTKRKALAWCACRALQNCGAGGGHRAAAVQALIEGGPTDALANTIKEVLTWHEPDATGLKLKPHVSTVEARERSPAELLAVEFDVGLHIRTRVRMLENPRNPYGKCKAEQCKELQEEEEQMLRDYFLRDDLWDCIRSFLEEYARQWTDSQALSIFLATDNAILRDEFVSRLSPYGATWYNNGSVAHVGESSASDGGRLPTMAEFFLLSKSHIIVELDSYMSTFAQFASTIGNCSLTSLPRQHFVPEACISPRLEQVGVWRTGLGPRTVEQGKEHGHVLRNGH